MQAESATGKDCQPDVFARSSAVHPNSGSRSSTLGYGLVLPVLVLTAGTALSLLLLGAFFHTSKAPLGIFSLELNFGGLSAMLGELPVETIHRMGFFGGLDYAFMLLYATSIALLFVKHFGVAQLLARAAIAAAYVAALCDAVENALLFVAAENHFIHHEPASTIDQLGWYITLAASIKFSLLLFCLFAFVRLRFFARGRLRSEEC